jgi:hypothetical protein
MKLQAKNNSNVQKLGLTFTKNLYYFFFAYFMPISTDIKKLS